jgi:hypothetical protein
MQTSSLLYTLFVERRKPSKLAPRPSRAHRGAVRRGGPQNWRERYGCLFYLFSFYKKEKEKKKKRKKRRQANQVDNSSALKLCELELSLIRTSISK